jgi:hypothetical protein
MSISVALLLPIIAGCAGNQAMILHAPRIHHECEIPVCEKVNKRDKECWRTYCLTQRQLEEMARGMQR